MSIFSQIFGSSTPAPAAQPAPANPNPEPGNANPNAAKPDAGNPTVPAGTVDASKKEPESPMDQFSTLWQPDPDANKGPAPLINVDPKQLAEAARKTDFSKMITPEQLTAIQGGGEQAAAAFAQALNAVAQGVYAQSAFATTKIVEQAVSKAREQFQADIPAQIKKHSVSDSLRNENPAFKHPAAAPILGAIEAQLITKYPNASASELNTLAKQYLENFASAVTGPANAAAAADAKKKGNQEFDWSNFLN